MGGFDPVEEGLSLHYEAHDLLWLKEKNLRQSCDNLAVSLVGHSGFCLYFQFFQMVMVTQQFKQTNSDVLRV